MPVTVTKGNTRLLDRGGGWVEIVHNTGTVDAEGKPILRRATVTRASVEVSAGVLLPKARVKAIAEAILNRVVAESPVVADVEIAGL